MPVAPMLDILNAAELIVEKGANYIRGVEKKSDWNSYVPSGVLARIFPVEYGGEGEPISSLVAIFEGLAYGGGDAGILFALAAQIWSVQYPVLRFGDERQKEEFLRPMIRGSLRAAHAATDPGSGSDVFHLQTTARPCPGGYRLVGQKRYITSAPVADIALVLASTDPQRHSWGVSAFLVDLNSNGVSRSSNVPKMGLQSAEFGELYFDDCFVPAGQRLGVEGAGGSVFSAALNMERAFIMAPALGMMRRELDQSVAYANTRTQNGRTIGSFQSVSNRIADIAIRLEISRLLLYHAAARADSNQSIKHYSALVKLVVSEFSVTTGMDAMRNKGAGGYLLDDSSSTALRDALGSLFYSGTSDILRNIIAGYAGVANV
ncbi:MAG TPA: acyl-CoA dehydrogenase family protein [Bryobacteraceae bacterium]|nr:acyl-CoA dehydrogenase family protein [Bryobacteraceae bacterium]